MPIFNKLLIWNDPTPHTGELNMAIDELLLQNTPHLPLLRIYAWSLPSISLGYFETLQSAKKSFPPQPSSNQPLQYIRRWTGGGIVDHRIDLTYTLIIPKTHPLATLRGAHSYHTIHQAIASALNHHGITCHLTPSDTGHGEATCFTNPVTHDIITPTGKKLAGAGQKRTRQGLLHQGSIIGIQQNNKTQFTKTLTKHLTTSPQTWHPPTDLLTKAHQLTTQKYATKTWQTKR